MRDPHVVSLAYLVSAEQGTEYRDPQPLVVEDALGSFRIAGNVLHVLLADHFPNEDEARAVVDP